MRRVVSLFLPDLAIERLRRLERSASRQPERPVLELPVDDDPGAYSVPRGGGWRPGARWARVDLSCGRRLLLYPTDRPAWSRITRLLTVGKKRAGKGGCLLHWHDLEPWSEGVVAILLPHEADEENVAALKDLKAIYGRRGYMALFQRRRPGDAVRIDALARQAGGAGVRAVVTGDVLYHAPEARLLQDVVTAVREKCTVDELGYRREVNADRALKSPDEMVRRFRAYPDALQASVDIARICTFDLGELAYQYPHERLIEGLSASVDELVQLASFVEIQMRVAAHGQPSAGWNPHLSRVFALRSRMHPPTSFQRDNTSYVK